MKVFGGWQRTCGVFKNSLRSPSSVEKIDGYKVQDAIVIKNLFKHSVSFIIFQDDIVCPFLLELMVKFKQAFDNFYIHQWILNFF